MKYAKGDKRSLLPKTDRIAVMYRGEFVAILDATTAKVEEIGLLMGGG